MKTHRDSLVKSIPVDHQGSPDCASLQPYEAHHRLQIALAPWIANDCPDWAIADLGSLDQLSVLLSQLSTSHDMSSLFARSLGPRNILCSRKGVQFSNQKLSPFLNYFACKQPGKVQIIYKASYRVEEEKVGWFTINKYSTTLFSITSSVHIQPKNSYFFTVFHVEIENKK